MGPTWKNLFILMFALSAPALAYIDPGASGFFIQFIMAIALGCVFYVKQIFRTITGFFRGKKKTAPESVESGESAT